MIRLFGWIVVCVLVAVALGWLASQISDVWSPMLVFPLLVGTVLGAILVVLMRACQVHAAWTVYPMAIIAVALVVASQHWLAYRQAVLAVNEDIQLLRKAAALRSNEFQGKIPVPPKNWMAFMNNEANRERKISTWFGEITLQGSKVWAFWSINVLLVFLPAWFLLRQGRARKWCPTCRSWYRVTRKGRLSLSNAESLLEMLRKNETSTTDKNSADQAKDTDKENEAQRFATYMISNCEGHCGNAEITILIPAKSVFETFSLNRDQCHMVEVFL